MLPALLDLILPASCPGCEAPRTGEGVFCHDCASELPSRLRVATPPALVDAAWTLADYAGPAGAAVRRAKYGGDRAALAALAGRLALAAPAVGLTHAVVPVPQSAWTTLSRADWPVRGLAAAVAEALDLPLLPALRRVGGTRQARLDPRQRRDNLRAAFEVDGAVPSRVLLVDDVITTGATASACAAELRVAGCSEVKVLAVCRASTF